MPRIAEPPIRPSIFSPIVQLRRHAADQIDQYHRILDRQSAGFDGGTGGRRLEELLPCFVKSAEIVQVAKEYLRLYDVIQRAAGGSRLACQQGYR